MDDSIVRIFLVLVVVAATSGSGCGDGETNSTESTATAPQVTDPAHPAVRMQPSEQEARQFGQAVVEAVRSPNTVDFEAFIDYESVFATATRELRLTPSEHATHYRKFLDGMGSDRDLLTTVQKQSKDGVRFDLVHVDQVEGEWRALFRVTMPDFRGINYYDMLLARADGRVRARDAVILFTGERLSETIRRLWIALAQSGNSQRPNLTNSERLYSQYSGDFSRIARTYDSNPSEALQIFQSLPSELQRDKAVLFLRLRAALNSGDEGELAAAVDDLKKEYPGDPTSEFLGVHHYCRRGEYAKALTAVESMDEFVRKDPFLDGTRANILRQAGRLEEAERAAERAVSSLPDNPDAYWELLTIALQQEDFAKTLDWLERIDRSFDIEWDDLTTVETYGKFVTSPQHDEWRKYIEARHSPESN